MGRVMHRNPTTPFNEQNVILSSTLANFASVGERIFASAAGHDAEFLYGLGAAVNGKKIWCPLFLGTFRAGAAPKLAKVKLRRSRARARPSRRMEADSERGAILRDGRSVARAASSG